mmetsp:Transcript_7247/g.22228  ORF Transcript_7247/g.22228 Transcript_7247/m.22228 type:complete len:177 (-) Transcript_7247:40-570(-)
MFRFIWRGAAGKQDGPELSSPVKDCDGTGEFGDITCVTGAYNEVHVCESSWLSERNTSRSSSVVSSTTEEGVNVGFSDATSDTTRAMSWTSSPSVVTWYYRPVAKRNDLLSQLSDSWESFNTNMTKTSTGVISSLDSLGRSLGNAWDLTDLMDDLKSFRHARPKSRSPTRVPTLVV